MKKFLFVIVSLLSFSWALAQVNINTATAQELQTLSGIGPAKAAAIVEYRTANGPFKSPEDIKNVRGIGNGIYQKISSKYLLPKIDSCLQISCRFDQVI